MTKFLQGREYSSIFRTTFNWIFTSFHAWQFRLTRIFRSLVNVYFLWSSIDHNAMRWSSLSPGITLLLLRQGQHQTLCVCLLLSYWLFVRLTLRPQRRRGFTVNRTHQLRPTENCFQIVCMRAYESKHRVRSTKYYDAQKRNKICFRISTLLALKILRKGRDTRCPEPDTQFLETFASSQKSEHRHGGARSATGKYAEK